MFFSPLFYTNREDLVISNNYFYSLDSYIEDIKNQNKYSGVENMACTVLSLSCIIKIDSIVFGAWLLLGTKNLAILAFDSLTTMFLSISHEVPDSPDVQH